MKYFCARNTSFRNIADGPPTSFIKPRSIKFAQIETEFKSARNRRERKQPDIIIWVVTQLRKNFRNVIIMVIMFNRMGNAFV